jgi:hypothetical protein
VAALGIVSYRQVYFAASGPGIFGCSRRPRRPVQPGDSREPIKVHLSLSVRRRAGILGGPGLTEATHLIHEFRRYVAHPLIFGTTLQSYYAGPQSCDPTPRFYRVANATWAAAPLFTLPLLPLTVSFHLVPSHDVIRHPAAVWTAAVVPVMFPECSRAFVADIFSSCCCKRNATHDSHDKSTGGSRTGGRPRLPRVHGLHLPTAERRLLDDASNPGRGWGRSRREGRASEPAALTARSGPASRQLCEEPQQPRARIRASDVNGRRSGRHRHAGSHRLRSSPLRDTGSPRRCRRSRPHARSDALPREPHRSRPDVTAS